MKVLLTGASGFVGSHILQRLLDRRVPTAVLLRSSSSRSFLPEGDFETRYGEIDDSVSLRKAMSDVSHVIHCAGRTKACRPKEYFETNQLGTRHVVASVNACGVGRLLHISSLAASGPATAFEPCTEGTPCRPISVYGQSKLAAEQEVREGCMNEWVIIRPPAVYGPRDQGFLTLFKAVASHLLPKTNARQQLSLVYVEDLAGAVVAALESPAASGRTYFAAAPEVVTARQMAECIARKLGTWTVPVPLPAPALWPLCLVQDLYARVSGRAALLNLQKFAELRAPGWVCDASLLSREVGYSCTTNLEAGVAKTVEWYQQRHWL